MFWKDLGLGFRTYGQAFNVIFSKGLWWFFIFPIILNILLLWGGFEGVDMIFDWISSKIMQWTNLEKADFWGAGALRWILDFLLKGTLYLVFLAFFAYLSGFIVLIFLSPILAYLSEKTEKILTGNEYPFSAEQLMRDIWRGILLALRNMFIELGWSFIMLIIWIIPIIGWLIHLFQLHNIWLFIVASYFYGFSFMDYSIERQKLNVRKSVHLVRKRKGVALANGMIFSVCLFIPYIGITLSGFTAIISTVAAAIAMIEIVKQEKPAEIK
ncbi:MAG: hypothetical protein Kow0068_04330 [Marinilabiliales bacterium]